MSPLRLLYLAIAVVGAILPMFYFIRWFEEFGYDLGAMVTAWNVSDATTGLVWDLTVAAVALTVAVIAEAIARRQWLLLICIPATFGVGVSFGLPLYFFLRHRSA